MTAPVIASTSTYASSAASASHSVPMPATVNSGDLLLMVGGYVSDNGAVSASGWTLGPNFGRSVGPSLFVMWRDADGSEGGTNVSVSLPSSQSFSAYVARITGAELAATIAPEYVNSETSGASGAPNPPSLTPTGTKDFLCFGVGVSTAITNTTTNGDTDFVIVNSSFDSGRVCLVKTHNSAQTGTYDPAAFGTSTADWVSQTVAIHPASGGGGGSSVYVSGLSQRNRRSSGRYM